MKKTFLFAAMALLILRTAVAGAAVVTELPDPNTPIPGVPGENVATLHDDFYAYSAKLNTLLGYPGFDVSTGSGTLDLVLYTGAGGKHNVFGGFTFEDPMDAPGGSAESFSGTWGLGLQDEGPVAVDDLYSYLQTAFGPDFTTPVFNFDMNQVGNGPGQNIYLAGKISIWDPTANSGAGGSVASWAFDGIDNDQFDVPDLNDVSDPAWVLAQGVLGLGPYSVNNNTGSGKLDFVAYAPGMDLSQYLGNGYQFRADFYLGGLTSGFEELYMSGNFTPPSVVPEPLSLMLFGAGLAGLAGVRRKTRRI